MGEPQKERKGENVDPPNRGLPQRWLPTDTHTQCLLLCFGIPPFLGAAPAPTASQSLNTNAQGLHCPTSCPQEPLDMTTSHCGVGTSVASMVQTSSVTVGVANGVGTRAEAAAGAPNADPARGRCMPWARAGDTTCRRRAVVIGQSSSVSRQRLAARGQ